MLGLKIRTAENKSSYVVTIAKDFSAFKDKILPFISGEKVAVITDSVVNEIYPDVFSDCLKNKIVCKYVVSSGEKSKNTDKIFMHKCPFLIDKRCSVYQNRGIICRTFGLLCEHNDGRLTIPFCHEYGLNYAQLYDKELGQLIDERDGIKLSKTEPAAFRIERDNIMNLSIAKNLNIVWGDSKTMIDFINQTNIDD